MLKLRQNAPTRGDCMSGYEVILDKDYTVKELLDEVLSRTGEWGYFCVKNGSSIEYRYGKCLSALSGIDSQKQVSSVNASGGYSRMDYTINTK